MILEICLVEVLTFMNVYFELGTLSLLNQVLCVMTGFETDVFILKKTTTNYHVMVRRDCTIFI